MSDFVTLTCPSCGGKLQITNDIERFACGHCGNEHMVKRGGGIVSLAPVVNELKKVAKSSDRTAIETTIIRLNGEISTLRDRSDELKRRINRSHNQEMQNYFAARRGGLGGLFTILLSMGSQDNKEAEILELDNITVAGLDNMIARFTQSAVSFSYKELVANLKSIKNFEEAIIEKQKEVQDLKMQLR